MGFGGAPASAAPMMMPSSSPSPGAQAKAVLPGATANAAARAGGGISPQFLSGLVDQQTGTPGSGLDIIGQIRSSLGQGGGG